MSLNPQQETAVQTLDGPLLIIAGAGSGKTRVLTHRIANLIQKKKARPHEVLAVTFTNKAAQEMKERVNKILGEDEKLWVSTFHSACVRILREEISVLGYAPNFVIYDDQDQLTLIRQTLKILNWDEKDLSPKNIRSQIHQAKNKGLSPKHFLKKAISTYEEKISEVFLHYQGELKKNNALDFDDLLSLTVDIFKSHPKVLEKYRNRFHYCLVDEYQDTNHIQYLLIKLLCEEHQNICVVGDEDQSIYSWRGADISNILSFEKDFPNAKVIKLEQNYRSTKNIIEGASAVISNNKDRKPKKLWTKNEEGVPVHLVLLEDEYHEARFVVGEILRFQEEEGKTLSEFSVFYRTHAQSRILEELLRQNQLPYQIYGGIHFYGRAEVKDMMAYLRLILNPKEDVSFLRVINSPARGIGKTTIEKIRTTAREQGVSLFEGARALVQDGNLSNSSKKRIEEFISLMEDLRKEREKKDLTTLYHEILEKTHYVELLKEEGTVEAESRIENLEELDSAISEFAKRNPKAALETYLEEISLVSDIDSLNEADEHVKLMTLHSAKGLEFPVVFMVGLEEGLFPHRQSDWDPSEMEEERRLCYVGMTRSKKYLYMTHANARRIHGILQLNLRSRFLDEIPKEYLQEMDLRRRIKKTYKASVDQDLVQDEVFQDDFNQDFEEKLYFAGLRVRHPSFGRGVICRVEGNNETPKVTVKFENGQVKKFIATQAPLERL